jgi:mannose-6-phosphate isomerase-like protein (cupin superfamily)
MLVRHDHEHEPEIWRDGVTTRMYASAASGAHQVVAFEQWCSPGNGAPSHLHAVEEILRITSGSATVWVGDDQEDLTTGASIIIPAGVIHGFRNTGSDTLQVLAILAEPVFEARYVEGERDVRRWGDAGNG